MANRTAKAGTLHGTVAESAECVRILKESADMIFLPAAHSFREIAAKAGLRGL